MKIYGIGDFSKMIGVTQQTLRNWDKLGKLKPHHVSDSGYRYYSQAQKT
jgi:putative resolvase